MSFFAEAARVGVENAHDGAPAATKDDVVLLAKQIGLTPVQLSRHWSTPKLRAHFTQVPSELQDAVFNLAHAVHVMQARGAPPSWLTQPAPELRGYVPLALLQTLHGTDFVFAAIDRIARPR